MTPDAADLFARLDREVWLVTARAGARRGGLIATFVGQASIVPDLPRVVVGVARQHHTWELIEAGRAFALHLLAEDNLDWVWRFGLRTGREGDKLAGLEVREGATGSPLLAGALGWLDCRVEAGYPTGDRSLFLGEVVAAEASRPGAPLTAQRLLRLAPAERRQQLKDQMARDGSIDAQAIRAWRSAAGATRPS